MAKRVRGSSSRPGQRAPLQRSASTARPAARPTSTTASAAASTVATPPSGLTAAEEARAADLEAQIVADEQAAETGNRRRERSRRVIESEGGVASGAIAMSASQEYAYVARDVRRLLLIGGGLVGVLLALWAVISATGIGPF